MFYLLQAVISLSSAPPWWALLLSSCSLRRQNQHAGEGRGGVRKGRGKAHARHGRLAADVDRPRAREESERGGGRGGEERIRAESHRRRQARSCRAGAASAGGVGKEGRVWWDRIIAR